MTLWYVGTPYSKFPAGLDAAFEMACEQTALLAEHEIPVYSPIAHSHPIAKYCKVSPTDHDFWVKFDAPMVALATGLIVIMADGWRQSRGLGHEIDAFIAARQPVVWMKPGVLPEEFA